MKAIKLKEECLNIGDIGYTIIKNKLNSFRVKKIIIELSTLGQDVTYIDYTNNRINASYCFNSEAKANNYIVHDKEEIDLYFINTVHGN